MEAVPDGAPPNDGELGVDVHGRGSRHEEEARFEVLEVVDREGVESLPVDGQDPIRQESSVEREEAGRVRE